jgi:hypothetical protein
MKLGTMLLAAALAACCAAFAAPSRAAEGPQDVETDHMDPFDDAGPRTFALLVNPGAMALGGFGAEADLALGAAAALSAQAEACSLGGADARALSLGAPLFAQRVPFHGLYVHPRLTWARVTTTAAGGATRDEMGLGATVGWAWTLRIGFTVRLGIGAMVERPLSGPDVAADAAIAPMHVRPLVDGMLGWAF